MCDLKKHNLTIIYSNDKGMCSEVVRWCKDCGAVVVDIDSDGRVFAGRLLPMQFPENIKEVKNIQNRR